MPRAIVQILMKIPAINALPPPERHPHSGFLWKTRAIPPDVRLPANNEASMQNASLHTYDNKESKAETQVNNGLQQ